jgi:hypothetical protein
MDRQQQMSAKSIFTLGLAATGAGLYFVLVSIGILPIPGGERALHGPLWIVFCAGLAFLLAGLALLIRVVAGESAEDGELPPSAPRWLRFAQYLFGLAIFGCFGLIGSWIAFGAGPRHFSMSGFLIGNPGEMFGRMLFGIGAVVIWLCMIAMAVAGARKLFIRDKVQRDKV